MKNPTRRAAATPTPATEPEERRLTLEETRLEPGSYKRQDDGSYLRVDEATQPGEVEGPRLPAKSARAIAEALAELGHDAPPYIEAAVPARDEPLAGEDPPPGPSGGEEEPANPGAAGGDENKE